MVKMSMGVENVAHGQPKFPYLVENSLVRSSGIHYDRLLRHGIADDRTIAAKGRNGKCFSNDAGHDTRMLQPYPIKAQAESATSARRFEVRGFRNFEPGT